MALGDGIGWDKTHPVGGDNLSVGADEIKDLRVGISDRLAKEHVDPAPASVGGEHLMGAARAFVVAAAETHKPDQATALDANDEGRLEVRDDGANPPLLEFYTGAAWRLATAAFALGSFSKGAGNEVVSLPFSPSVVIAGWGVAGVAGGAKILFKTYLMATSYAYITTIDSPALAAVTLGTDACTFGSAIATGSTVYWLAIRLADNA